jgi:hypothetical protein
MVTELKQKKEKKVKAVMGRPTIYGEEMLELTREYIASCGDKIVVKQKTHIEPDGTIKLVKGKPFVTFYDEKVFELPSIEGLAVYLDINPDTIQDWVKDEKKKDFSVLIKKLKAKQAKMLIEGGITGRYNPIISKTLLSKHGYSERIEQTGAEGKDLIPDKQSSEKAEAALEKFLKGKKK